MDIVSLHFTGIAHMRMLTHGPQEHRYLQRPSSGATAAMALHNIKNACPGTGDDVMCCFYPVCSGGVSGYCDISGHNTCTQSGGHWISYVNPPGGPVVSLLVQSR